MTSTISIGIDIAKAKFDVAFLGTDDSVRLETFSNARTGIRAFLRVLMRRGTDRAVPLVLEATGAYHLAVALMLTQAGWA